MDAVTTASEHPATLSTNETKKLKRYYRYSLLWPIVIPLLSLGILVIPVTHDFFWFKTILGLFLASLVVSIIPYLFFVIFTLIFIYEKDVPAIRKWLWYSPVMMALFFFILALFATESFVTLMLVFTGCSLAFGYFYVIPVLYVGKKKEKKLYDPC
ncbi:MAG: hypothetical protein CMM93_04065 [Rickettsiales bacterium]|nr:hypothetical protein [Rickettsiales bacterium]|tara:strand:- start:142 stop:609 length:468 start_codon:yes stop_codon:yes gene_type:complete